VPPEARRHLGAIVSKDGKVLGDDLVVTVAAREPSFGHAYDIGAGVFDSGELVVCCFPYFVIVEE
jgi:hypothetical protein